MYGGAGALGREIVAFFGSHGWRTTSVDLGPSETAAQSVVIPAGQHWGEQLSHVQAAIKGSHFDVIYCAAGGWAGGAIGAEDLVAGVDRMLAFNLYSAISCAAVAQATLNQGGLLVLTGAAAAIGNAPTPGMIAYGVSKAATHQLIASLAAPNSGLAPGSCVLGVCPITLDTPMNRKAKRERALRLSPRSLTSLPQGMPNADFSTWTPPAYVAQVVHEWAEAHTRPTSGSLFRVVTTGGVSHTEQAH